MFDISVSYIVLAALFVLGILNVWLNTRQWVSKKKLIKEVDSRVHGASVGRGLRAEHLLRSLIPSKVFDGIYKSSNF